MMTFACTCRDLRIYKIIGTFSILSRHVLIVMMMLVDYTILQTRIFSSSTDFTMYAAVTKVWSNQDNVDVIAKAYAMEEPELNQPILRGFLDVFWNACNSLPLVKTSISSYLLVTQPARYGCISKLSQY